MMTVGMEDDDVPADGTVTAHGERDDTGGIRRDGDRGSAVPPLSSHSSSIGS
jgi:hypothetical protein